VTKDTKKVSEKALPKDSSTKESHTQNINHEEILTNENPFEKNYSEVNPTHNPPPSELIVKFQETEDELNRLKRKLLIDELEAIIDEIAHTKKQLADYKDAQKRS